MADTAQVLFKTEYELELETWLRRRFRVICILFLALGAAILVGRALIIGFSAATWKWQAMLILIPAGLLQLAVVYRFLTAVHWAEATREQLLRGASQLVLIIGGIVLARDIVMGLVARGAATDFLLTLFIWHLVACCLLPWTPGESVRAFIPLLGAWMIIYLLFSRSEDLAGRVVAIVFAPGILIPGLAVCAIRLQQHGRSFRMRMVGKHFASMRQDYVRARNIHENLFPRPFDDGSIRFEYTYTPMRELGGDYIHLHHTSDGLVHLTLVDVTGHGLPAALTVNRLHGELERIHAEAQSATPQEIITLLNRYIHLTLAKHNIYATALAIAIDPVHGKLVWCSAGHPPAYLRSINGSVTELIATAVVLGALPDAQFAPQQSTIELVPGDAVVLYTDGAFEVRNRAGRHLGLDALKNLMHVQPPPNNWPQYVTSAAQRHAYGPPEDDLLVACLTYRAPITVKSKTEPSQEVGAAS